MYARNVRIKLKANGAPEFRAFLRRKLFPYSANRRDFRMKCSSSRRSGMRR